MEFHLSSLEISISDKIELNPYVKLVVQLFYMALEIYLNPVENKGRKIEINFYHSYFSQFSFIITKILKNCVF